MTENRGGKAERDPAPSRLKPEENSRFPNIPGMRFLPAPVHGADAVKTAQMSGTAAPFAAMRVQNRRREPGCRTELRTSRDCVYYRSPVDAYAGGAGRDLPGSPRRPAPPDARTSRVGVEKPPT